MGDKIYNIENITNAQFVTQSLDYQALVKQIEEKQELIDLYQETGKTNKALKAAAELETLEKQLADFKENVFRLYEIFTQIKIDTERLVQAKAYFEQGQFREADAILNAEEMAQDLDRLNEREQQLDHEKAAIAKSKTQLADEFLIKARLQTLTYDQADWFDRACKYFETALTATRTPAAVFEYALFLQNHNCFDQAQPLYQECLDQNRILAEDNPRTYLPYVATTLNNLANLQKAQNDFTTALASYAEALRMYRALAEDNPRTYLPYVATTLNNLANLQSDQNDFTTALASYAEALRMYRALAEDNPRTYLPDVAMTLINLSIFYLQAQPDQERSIALAAEALQQLKDFQDVPAFERYIMTAQQVLQANGVDLS